jgi:hypothetical protein
VLSCLADGSALYLRFSSERAVAVLQKITNNLGTQRDTPDLRERLKICMSQTTELIRDTSTDVKRVRALRVLILLRPRTFYSQQLLSFNHSPIDPTRSSAPALSA